jgi:uncharacterized membrane protein YqaE (UPF0057 family)
MIALFAVVCSISSNAAGILNVPVNATDNSEAGIEATIANVKASNMEAFLSLTPEKVKAMTGKKMTFVQKMALKMAQKKAKRAGGEIPKGLYIVLAIFGLAWIAMGVMDNWSGSTWIINLVLTFLFWLPGFIHALVVMKNYY